MLQKNAKRLMLAMIAVAVLAVFCTMIAYAVSYLQMDSEGLEASYDSGWSGGGKIADGTVDGTAATTCDSAKSNTATLTFKNTSTETKTLSFRYKINSRKGSITINGTERTADGSFSTDLTNGATVSIVLTSGTGTNQQTSISLSEITLVGNETVSTTFAVAEHGSYTVNGTAITADTTFEQAATDAYTVEATAESGYVFFGWQAEGQGYLSDLSKTDLKIEKNTTVKPIFVDETLPHFQVGSDRYYDLTEAITAAGTSGTIVVYRNGTLPAGEYTIPTGVTLLVPYSESIPSYANLEPTRTQASEKCTAFRTLTVPDDAVINCYGNIRVDACQHTTGNQTGHVSGSYGYIRLSGAINMKSGSNLMAYGYIAGSGTVNAESGANIYELFQICDWRGGQNSLTLKSKLKGQSFLFSQFYIQNIESTLVINHGAILTVQTTISASIGGYVTQVNNAVTLVTGGSDGLFNLGTNSTLTRTYSNGRVNYTINGDSTIGKISLNLPVVGTVDSSDYVLNLPSNMSVVVASGNTTFAYGAKLLPGTTFQINSGATFSLTGSAELILYDYDDWNNGNYAFTGKYFKPLYSVGGAMSSLPNSPGKLIVNGTLSIGSGAGVYSTNSQNAENGNAALSGTGTIVINSSAASNRSYIQEVEGSSTTLVDVTVAPLLATIAGKSETPTVSMVGGTTYYGLGSEHGNRWYVNKFEYPATCEVGAFVRYGDKNVTADTATDDNTYKVFTSEALGHDLVSHEAKAPTCTEIGWDAYNTCSRCDYSTYEEKAALGHTFGEWVITKKPTLTEVGSKTHTCSVCGETETAEIPKLTAVAQVGDQKFASVADALEAAPVNGTIIILTDNPASPDFNKAVTVDTNGKAFTIATAEGWTATKNESGLWVVKKVTGEGKFHIWASNVNMGNNLDMLFAIPKSVLKGTTGNYVQLVRTYSTKKDGTVDPDETITILQTEWQTLKQGDTEYYVITYGDFSAKEMCDTVTLTVYNAKNEPVSYPWTDSIRAYAMRIIRKPLNDAQAAVAIDMLNFGAAAQQHFTYGMDKLANDLLTDKQKEGSTPKDINNTLLQGDKFAGGNLVVTSHIRYPVIFTDQTADMYAQIEYTGHKGNTYSQKVTLQTLNGQECFIIDGLVVADARRPITITVYNADGNEYTTCQDSIEAYIFRKSQEQETANNVYAAFMKFADSAYAFLHQTTPTTPLEEVVQ